MKILRIIATLVVGGYLLAMGVQLTGVSLTIIQDLRGVAPDTSGVLLLPLVIPFGLVSDFVGRRRMRSAIVASKCPACGAQLNLEAMARGEARWKEIAREIWASHPPDARLRIVRNVHAVCCACGAELTYREASRDLAVRVP